MIDLNPQHLDLVKKILRKNLPQDAKVFVFGSRANGTAKKFSDLDLAIDVKHKISLSDFAKIHSDFEESDLPYKVDIIDLKTIEESFRNKIASDLIAIL